MFRFVVLVAGLAAVVQGTPVAADTDRLSALGADVPWAWEDASHPPDVTASRTSSLAVGVDSRTKTVAAVATVMSDVDTWGTKTICKDGVNLDTRPARFIFLIR